MRAIGAALQGIGGGMHAINRRTDNVFETETIERMLHASDAMLDLSDHMDGILNPSTSVQTPEASGEPSAEYEGEEDPER